MDQIIGLDIGTGRIRGVAVDLEGRPLRQAARKTPVRTASDGTADYDPEELFAIVLEVVGELSRTTPGRVVGIAAASTGEAGVPLDADGNPLGPAIAWFCPRTEKQAVWLREHVGEGPLFDITGMSLDRSLGLCKILWWRDNRPDVFARMRHWLNLADWIAYRLSGAMYTDFSLAARTLALDLRHGKWADGLLARLGIDAGLFAPLAPSGARVGRILPAIADRCGIDRRAIVGVGAHDHIAGAVAVGALEPGILLDSMGTAEGLILTISGPLFEPSLLKKGIHQSVFTVDAVRHLLLCGLPTCGAAVEWFRQTCAHGLPHEQLIAMAEEIAPGADGVGFVPHLTLGAAPRPEPTARGALLGLSATTNLGAMFRAVLEGLAIAAADAVDAMSGVPGSNTPTKVKVIGGGTQNALFLKIKASVYGMPLEVAPLAESTALGAAMLAGIASGSFATGHQAFDAVQRAAPMRIVDPDPSWQKVYAALRPIDSPTIAMLSKRNARVRQALGRLRGT